jgi:dihydroxyacid dehydratase/phosphogluconate dehydratase
VPDIFDYSLTEGRDIFALAEQCRRGQVRGMETVFSELMNLGVPMDGDAGTVTGRTWWERLSDRTQLSARGVADNPIILAQPRRPTSGVDVLSGNLFESAVVKISGMSDQQLTRFDDIVAIVLFFEGEEEANRGLLDPGLLCRLDSIPALNKRVLHALATHNALASGVEKAGGWAVQGKSLDEMAAEGTLRIAIVISGQGPVAFGMPEMFTPMQHINANRALRRLTLVLSDGRYSGVTYGAAIGHVTPEAFLGGKIGLLETGDLLHIQLLERRVDLIDPVEFSAGRVIPFGANLAETRAHLGQQRRERMVLRRHQIAVSNWLDGVTDAAHGVVPQSIWEETDAAYRYGPSDEEPG